ncbi:unnamed protein product [Tilletia controversa]|nr:unnamed protein product [Tilletia controversa]
MPRGPTKRKRGKVYTGSEDGSGRARLASLRGIELQGKALVTRRANPLPPDSPPRPSRSRLPAANSFSAPADSTAELDADQDGGDPGWSAFDPSDVGDQWYADADDGLTEEAKAFRNWHELVPTLLNAYNALDSTNRSFKPVSTITCVCARNSPLTSVTLVVYAMEGRRKLSFASCVDHVASVLLSHRLFPASPIQPQAAFEMSMLRWYEALRKMSSIGAHNFALALWDTYQDDDPELQINEFMRRQLRFAASWLQTVRAYGTIAALHGTSPWSVPRPVLDEDDLILTLDDLIDTCPACFAKFKCTAGPHVDDTEERPHPDKPQLIVSLDGNFTQKRKRREDNFLQQTLPPRRFLSLRQVTAAEESLGNNSVVSSSSLHHCTAQVKAADPMAPKASGGFHDVTGVMGLCCRHDIPLPSGPDSSSTGNNNLTASIPHANIPPSQPSGPDRISTGNSNLAASIPHANIPPFFGLAIDQKLFNVMFHMSKVRKRLALKKVGEPPTGQARNDTSLLAHALFRRIAQFKLLQAQVNDRTGTRYGYELTKRLNEALSTEKSNALKALRDFNDHITKAYPRQKHIAPDLLFEYETQNWVSTVASEGSVLLPWWSNRYITGVLDAFDRLNRIAEEFQLIKEERTSLQLWVKRRLEEVRGRITNAQQPTLSQLRVLGRLTELNKLWRFDVQIDVRDADELVNSLDTLNVSGLARDSSTTLLLEQDHVVILAE